MKSYETYSLWIWITHITVLYIPILFIFSNCDPVEIEIEILIWMSVYFINNIFVGLKDYVLFKGTNTFVNPDCLGPYLWHTIRDT